MPEWDGSEWGWSEQAQTRFARYYELLVEWNERMNLTNIVDRQEVYVKHFYDSVWVREIPEWQRVMRKGGRAVDVGTGAGFPGMALAILEPECEFVLLDALQKRVGFLMTVANELGLQNVRVVHARAEDGARQSGLRASFDAVLSRAVARLNVLMEYTLPFAKVGGTVFAYKGPGVEEEWQDGEVAAKALGGSLTDRVDRPLPEGMGERVLVVVPKVTQTPRAYPRKAGTPQRQPLKAR